MEGSTCFLRSLNPLRGIQLHSVRVILSLSLARSALSDTILSVSLLITLILGAFNLMIGRTVS